jgi:hypothetical protein
MEKGEEMAKVKTEKGTYFARLVAQHAGATIDLSTPSPKKRNIGPLSLDEDDTGGAASSRDVQPVETAGDDGDDEDDVFDHKNDGFD